MNGAWEKNPDIAAESAAISLKIPYNDPTVLHRLSRKIEAHLQLLPPDRRITIVCVGTDRSTGDSLGPLVGTALHRERCSLFDLYGTLDEPVHAMNLGETLHRISRSPFSPYIIAVDACLGQVSSVGCIQLGSGPVRPGAGVNKELPPVGDIHMTGIVNVGGFMEYFVLQNTRLNLVVKMSEIIAQSLLRGVSGAHNRSVTPFAWPD